MKRANYRKIAPAMVCAEPQNELRQEFMGDGYIDNHLKKQRIISPMGEI
jgi:hypothetical protein